LLNWFKNKIDLADEALLNAMIMGIGKEERK
jgi:hypothetical protein